MRATRTVTLVVRTMAVAYTVFVLVVTLRPTLDDVNVGGVATSLLRWLHGVGVPAWFDYDVLEFTANIGMFAVLGLLWAGAVRWKARGAVVMAVIIILFSVAIELVQGAFLAGRVSDIRDVVANGIGGVGAFLATWALRRRQ